VNVSRRLLAPAALFVVNLGGAVLFGISDVRDPNPTAAKIAFTALFAGLTLLALFALLRPLPWLGEVAFASGFGWAVVGAYIATSGAHRGLSRIGFAILCVGIALGCFAYWHAVHDEATR
jgi:4-hydroxybenzoate polyprenyltransferase